MARLVLLAVLVYGAAAAGDWSEPVLVTHQDDIVVQYRARLDGPYLVVKVALEPGWHTFAMDNERRAKERLAGKMSLGIDQQTEIKVEGGLKLAGPWYQPKPKDFSKPDLRWFSFGFEKESMFVAKVEGAAPAELNIRGQACTETTCKNINVDLTLPAQKPEGAQEVDLTKLVQVR
jgi:DsbC/DsbD-like thiol-disulfide interchange protein